jgi:large subunit ribosomal protein L29
MNAKELRQKTVEELQAEIRSLLKEQFNLRMQRGTGQMSRPHLMREVRKNVARAKTVLNEKQGKGQ